MAELKRMPAPSAAIRLNRCHMPWYEIGADEVDMRLDVGPLLTYIMLILNSDRFGRFKYGLRELYEDFPGGCPNDPQWLQELGNRLTILCNRPAEYDDAYTIRATSQSPDFNMLTPAKKLRLEVTKYSARTEATGFFYVHADAIQTLMKNCDRRNCSAMIMTYLYLLSKMRTVEYVDSSTNATKRGSAFTATHDEILDALGLEQRTLTRYISALNELGLIGYKPGGLSKNTQRKYRSIFTVGICNDLMQSAENVFFRINKKQSRVLGVHGVC